MSIPLVKRKLVVSAEPREKSLEPGSETTVELEVRDATGKPVQGGEVALVVVDEAVLALSNYQLADPLKTFYEHRGADVSDHHLREKVMLARSADLISKGGQVIEQVARNQSVFGSLRAVPNSARVFQAEMVRARLVASEANSEVEIDESIRTRLDFNALALFAPTLPTDANGRASVKVKMPDNLTRYRIMA